MAMIIGAAVSAVGGIAGAAGGGGGSGGGGGGLFDPSAPPNVPTAYRSDQTLPDWYVNAQQGLLNDPALDAANAYALAQPDRASIAAEATDPLYTGANNMIGYGINQLGRTVDPSLDANTFASYMDPYTAGVVDRIAELGDRNLMENILPGVNDTFTAAGQFGGDRNADFEGRAIRDTTKEIAGAQAGALEHGFETSLAGYNTGMGRAQAAVPLYNALAQTELGVAKGVGDAHKTRLDMQREQQEMLLNPTRVRGALINSMKVPVSTSGETSGPLPGSTYGPSPAAGIASAVPGVMGGLDKMFSGGGSPVSNINPASGGTWAGDLAGGMMPMARGGLVRPTLPRRGALAGVRRSA